MAGEERKVRIYGVVNGVLENVDINEEIGMLKRRIPALSAALKGFREGDFTLHTCTGSAPDFAEGVKLNPEELISTLERTPEGKLRIFVKLNGACDRLDALCEGSRLSSGPRTRARLLTLFLYFMRTIFCSAPGRWRRSGTGCGRR